MVSPCLATAARQLGRRFPCSFVQLAGCRCAVLPYLTPSCHTAYRPAGSEETAAAVAARADLLQQQLLAGVYSCWGVDPATRLPALAASQAAPEGAGAEQPQQGAGSSGGNTAAAAAMLAEIWKALGVFGLLPQALGQLAAYFLEHSIVPILASGAPLITLAARWQALRCVVLAGQPGLLAPGQVALLSAPPSCRAKPLSHRPSLIAKICRARPIPHNRQPRRQRGEQQPEPGNRSGRRPWRQQRGATAVQGAASAD